MAARWMATLVFLSLANPALADWKDNPKLRATIAMPDQSFNFGIGFNEDGEIRVQGEGPSKAVRAAELEKQLRGDDTDCIHYIHLSYLQEDKQKGKALAEKALAMAQRQHGLNPDGLTALLLLAEAHAANKNLAEAEKLFRRATERHPRIAGAWIKLGQLMIRRSTIEVLGSAESSILALAQLAAAGRSDGENWKRAAKCFQEAEACFERAVEMEPNNANTYLARAMGCYLRNLCGGLLSVANDGDQGLEAGILRMFHPNLLRDLHKAAECAPERPRVQAVFIMYDLLLTMVHEKVGGANLRGIEIKAIHQGAARATARLQKLVDCDDPEIAGDAAFLHATLTLSAAVMGNGVERKEGEVLLNQLIHSFRRATTLRPHHKQSWDLLESCLMKNGMPKEALDACLAHLRLETNAAQQYRVGEMMCDLKLPRQAEPYLRAAIQAEPENARYQLGLAACLYAQTNNAAVLERAGQQLERAEALFEVVKGRADITLRKSFTASTEDFDLYIRYLRGVHAALNGDAGTARSRFYGVLEKDKERTYVRKALETLPVAPIVVPPQLVPPQLVPTPTPLILER